MSQYLSFTTLDYLRSSSGDQQPTGELRKLRFSVTNPGRRPDEFTLLAKCSKDYVSVNVHPSKLRLGSGERSEVELLFRCPGLSRGNLWLFVSCLQGEGQLADQRSICVNVGDDGHVRVVSDGGRDRTNTTLSSGQAPIVNQSENEEGKILAVEPTKEFYLESLLDPSSARVDSAVVKVYTYDPYCIHLKFKAVRDGIQDDFCLAGVKYIASGDDKVDRERALTRFAELVETPDHRLGVTQDGGLPQSPALETQAEGSGPPAPKVRLGVVPGSGTPLLAHLGVSRGGGEERDVAAVLLEEGLVVPDDGLTYSRGGYSAMAHGNVFHWHLVMLILLRMRSQARSFRLAVEYQPAGKLDDVYLSVEGEDGAWEHMYMQLKHSASGSGKIKLADLVKVKQKGPPPKLCLKGFAQSYKNISNKKGRTYCIVFTNQGLGFEDDSESSSTGEEFQLKIKYFHDSDITYPSIFQNKPLRFNGKSISELSKLLTDKNLTVEDAQMFLQHFYFAVNQWNAKELKEIVQAEMLEECQGRSDVMENKYSRVLEWIQSWMEREEGDYIDNQKLEEFFQRINLEIQGSINILPRNVIKNFYKRDKEENIASKTLNLPRGDLPLDIVIIGQPGIGKTEFALRVVENNKKKFDHIVWVNADSKSSLQNAFLQLGKRLNVVANQSLNSIEENLKLTVEKIYYMFSNYKTLFIFDGVRDYVDIKEFLPSPGINCSSIYIIATSNCTLPCNKLIKLECFSIRDSVYFLGRELGLHSNKGAEELANLLGNHPMALQLAVSFIKHTRNLPGKKDFSISDFIKDHQRYLMKDIPSSTSYEKNLAMMWNMSMETVKVQNHGELAIKILGMMAYMEPEHIPLSIFKKLNEINSDFSYEESLLLAREYSLLNYYDEKGSIHKLLQLVTRHNCKNEKEVLTELLKLLEIKITKENPEFLCADITPHAMKVWFYANQHEDLIKQFDIVPVAIAYSNLSPETIISFIEQFISNLETVLSWQNRNFLRFLARYIELLWKCEIYTRVIELCELHSTIMPEIFKNCNIELTRIHANSLQKLGKLEESWSLWQTQYWHEVSVYGMEAVKTVETLKIMLKISYKLCKNGNNGAFKTFLNIIEERYSGSVASVEVSLDLLSSISSVVSLEGLPDSLQLPLLGSIHRALTVSYEETHVAALFVLLAKARQLCRMGRGDEGRLLYVRVCQLVSLDPGPPFSDLQDFLESLYSQLGPFLDFSRGLLKVLSSLLTDSKVDLKFLKLMLREKIARKAVEATQEAGSVTVQEENLPQMCFMGETFTHLPVQVSEQVQASSASGRSLTLGSPSSLSPIRRGFRHSTSSDIDDNLQFSDSESSKDNSEAQHLAVVGMLERNDSPGVSKAFKEQVGVIKNLKRHKKHSQVIFKCDKLLSSVPPDLMDNEDVLSVLQSKAESLHTTRHDQEAAQIWDELFARRTNSLGPDHLDTVHTLLGMCRTAIALESAGNEKCFQSWSDLIRNRLNDGSVDCRKTFDVFQNIVSCLKESGKEEFAITLCRTFNNTLVGGKGENDPLTLCNLLLQAECLWDVHKEREAWDIYTRVCNVRKVSVTNIPIKSVIFVLRIELWNLV